MKRQVEVIRELKTGKRLSDLKGYPHLRRYDFSLSYMSFLAFVLDNQAVFTSACLNDYFERGQSKYILRKFETGARFVSSTFDEKRMIIYISFRCYYQALSYSIAYMNENCQAAIIFNNLGI